MSYSIALGAVKPAPGPSCPQGYLWDTERKVCVQKPQGPLVVVTEESYGPDYYPAPYFVGGGGGRPHRRPHHHRPRHRFHGADLGFTVSGMPMASMLIFGLGGLAVFGGSMAGLTYAHRKKGATWYCSLMPSAFWASLITGVAETAAVLVVASRMGAQVNMFGQTAPAE